MPVLLTGKLSSSSFAHINSGGDGRTEAALRSTSVSSRQSYNDGDSKRKDSSMPHMSIIRKNSVTPVNALANDANRKVTSVPDTCLKRIKRSYKHLHLNHLLSLAFMMIYMFIGALLFLWLEEAADQARKLHDYKYYIHKSELFLKQLDEIYNVQVSERQRFLLKKAVDYLHREIGVSFSNRSEWSLTTALYYSGTVLTTIGYGDVVCRTTSGRLMTVIYAIVGIPIMLITLRDLGNFLYKVMINAVQLMNFTSRKCRIFVNRKNQQSNTNLARLESGCQNASKNNAEHENGNQDYGSKKTKFEVDAESTDGKFYHSMEEEKAKMVNYDDAILRDRNRPSRIPIVMAIGTTFGWIFLCAGVFKIWEHDWTYAESCYFMFISLSTIGLGDIAVRRRDLMIMCFVFVVIGLAMVSMCISVIQTALEDFFMNFFLKLFLEYQSKLNQGNDVTGASIGVMQIWDNNKKAKCLMSFLSKDRRTSVLGKAQKDAEACGIEVPPIFSTIDEESGIPMLLTKDVDEATIAVAVEEAVQKQVEAERNTPIQAQIQPALPKTVFYDTGVQTCHIFLDDKAEQTLMITVLDKANVTDSLTNEMVEVDVQCSNPVLAHHITQTEVIEMKDSECMPVISEYMESNVQTEEARLVEQEIQTHLYDVLEALTQTETCVQKPLPVMVESEMQTLISEIRKTRPKISQMKKERLRDIGLRRRSTYSSLSNLTDLSEDERDTDEDLDSNTLDWNPIDGMHAKKQRPVRDLKQFFEANEKRNSIRRSSKLRSSQSPSQIQQRST